MRGCKEEVGGRACGGAADADGQTDKEGRGTEGRMKWDLDGREAGENKAGGRASQDKGRATLLLSCLCLGYLFKASRHFFLGASHYKNALNSLVVK